MPGSKFYFNPKGKGLEVFLGPTEAKLMEIAFEEKTLTVKRASFLMGENSNLAYTTVMTILNRLANKELLKRAKDGKTCIYSPVESKNKFITGKLKTINNSLKQFK